MSSISIKQYNKLIGKKTSKFNAKPVWACPVCWNPSSRNGCCYHPGKKTKYFPSTGEFKYWIHLLTLEKAGMISDLKRQIPYKLEVNGMHVTKYTPDYEYIENGVRVIVDYKGKDTDASRVRRKLFHAIEGVEVVLMKSSN